MALRPRKLAKAIERTEQDIKDIDGLDDDPWSKANYIINFFGYQDRIIDNDLNREEREVFYSLEDAGLVKSGGKETTLFIGGNWSINYWTWNKEEINSLVGDGKKGENSEGSSDFVYNEWDEEHFTEVAENREPKSRSQVLEEFEGYIIEEDLELAEVEAYELDCIEDKDDLNPVALKAGNRRKKERKEKWSYHPDEDEKKEIRNYLVEEIKKRPKVTSHLFNKLMGIGFQTYFDSFNELREEAGLEGNTGSRRFEREEGKEKLMEYALGETLEGERVTQKKIREEFGLHVDSYGYEDMQELKYKALEITAFEMLRRDPGLSKNKLSQEVGYAKKTVREHIDFEHLKDLVSDEN